MQLLEVYIREVKTQWLWIYSDLENIRVIRHIFVFKILPKEKHIYAEKKEIRKRGNKEKRTKLNNV